MDSPEGHVCVYVYRKEVSIELKFIAVIYKPDIWYLILLDNASNMNEYAKNV
jgi:hypothetical protein